MAWSSQDFRIRMGFEDITFMKGVTYSTVRRGAKECPEGHLFDILNMKGEAVGIGKILFGRTLPFPSLSRDDLLCEQLEECHTVKGLTKKMLEWHSGFDRREIVTVIYFTVHHLYEVRM